MDAGDTGRMIRGGGLDGWRDRQRLARFSHDHPEIDIPPGARPSGDYEAVVPLPDGRIHVIVEHTPGALLARLEGIEDNPG